MADVPQLYPLNINTEGLEERLGFPVERSDRWIGFHQQHRGAYWRGKDPVEDTGPVNIGPWRGLLEGEEMRAAVGIVGEADLRRGETMLVLNRRTRQLYATPFETGTTFLNIMAAQEENEPDGGEGPELPGVEVI